MARGDRADVYLAVAEADPDDRDDEDEDRPEPTLPLVVVRVYPAGADDATLAVEIEAMSADASSTLPALHDVASFPDGRCCLIVERIGGPALSRILIERTLTPGEAVTILAPIVVAVAELAARGFVPGRLSTSDILIDEAGRPHDEHLHAVALLLANGVEDEPRNAPFALLLGDVRAMLLDALVEQLEGVA